MRGFSKPPTATVTFTSGTEQITYTLYGRTLTFEMVLEACWPRPTREDASAHRTYWSRRSLVTLAHCLRDESFPPHPDPATSTPEEWDAYGDQIASIMDAAGLTRAQVDRLADEAMRISEATDLRDAGGNSSAPGLGTSPTPGS